MHPDSWHFPRPELAGEYISTFTRGLTAARGLFARRRMGKTEFLEKDLVPAAREAGYLTAYVNLWDNRSNPGLAIATAMFGAVEAKGVARMLEKFRQPVNKIKAGAKFGGGAEGSIEAELGARTKKPANTVLGETMAKLDEKRRKMLLLIDEAQVLAATEHGDFAHALRAALDIRKDYIKVIFAGSSESTLRTMFGRSSEPFYNWAALEPFQLLEQDFVEALVKKVNDLSRFPLDVDAAQAAFVQLHSTPEFFRRYLEHYLSHATDGAAAALAHTKEHVFSDKVYLTQWQTMLPADQFILAFLASEEQESLYGKPIRDKLAAALGLTEVTKSTVQNAVARLARRNMVTAVGEGKYQFEDQAFGHWVRERGQGE
jgi:hypothetical protein